MLLKKIKIMFNDLQSDYSDGINGYIDETFYGKELMEELKDNSYEPNSKENTNHTDEEKEQNHRDFHQKAPTTNEITTKKEITNNNNNDEANNENNVESNYNNNNNDETKNENNIESNDTNNNNDETNNENNIESNYNNNNNDEINNENNIESNDINNIMKSTGDDTDNINHTQRHDKFSDDNLRKKIKDIILDKTLLYINEKIRRLYNNNIGKGICRKQLLKLNKKKISSTKINYNKEFLHKTLEDIFSEQSTQIKNFPEDFNKNLIKSLMNETDYNKSKYFQKLFNLTFLECLNHFIGKEIHEELIGMTNMNKKLEEFSNDGNYKQCLNYYFVNYESIINRKIGRKPRI